MRDRLTSTGSGFFAFLGSGFAQRFGKILTGRIKTVSNSNWKCKGKLKGKRPHSNIFKHNEIITNDRAVHQVYGISTLHDKRHQYARKNMFHARNRDTIVCFTVQILTSLKHFELKQSLSFNFSIKTIHHFYLITLCGCSSSRKFTKFPATKTSFELTSSFHLSISRPTMTSEFQRFQDSNCISRLKRTTVSIFQGKRLQADISNLKNIRFVGRPRALSAEVTIHISNSNRAGRPIFLGFDRFYFCFSF